MALFNWSDQYSVGIPSMDTQHQRLFEILNELHSAMKTGKATQAISTALDELIDYTRYHFREEEALMEQIHYPDLPEQKQAHQNLLLQLKELKQELKNGKTTLVAIKVSKTVLEWLKNHTTKMDKKYEQYMKANGIKLDDHV